MTKIMTVVVQMIDDDGNQSQVVHCIPSEDFEKYVQVTKELHTGKCYNPKTQRETLRAVSIYGFVPSPDKSYVYWWSTPGLETDPDKGARIMEIETFRYVDLRDC